MILFILFYFILIWWVLSRFEKIAGPFNMIFFFSLFHVVYTLMIPLEIKYLPFTRFSSRYNLNLDLYIFWSFISYAGFIIPFFLIPKNVYENLNNFSKLDLRKALKNINIFLFFFIFLGLVFFKDSFILAGTYEGNVNLSSNSLYKYYIDILTMLLVVCLSANVRCSNFISGLLIFIVLLFFSVYTSDKNPLFLGGVGLLFGMSNSFKKITSFQAFFIALFILPLFALLFNSFRAGSISYFELFNVLYTNSDPRGPFESIISAQKDYLVNGDFKLGMTYFESMINWIPSFIWSSRPIDLGTQYAMDNIQSYTKGMGLGYSPIAEGVLNFGYFGPFIQYFLNSLLIVLFFLVGFKNDFLDFKKFIFNLFILYFIVLMHRSPFNFFAVFFRIFLPLIIIFNLRKLTIR
jgi:hypothetical protein